ncbi:hypothetical protein Ddye_028956 [Dipteronia dyeriana]|uniref:Peptidase metallopeptidase domain-containing protein n=1 Tax=Dipteronia dyeriana TaxID=168575 RepID=A0AAD9TDJ1_9ROSI|nr:hypothetical protein Ddye_028956 [Dipteronia dyeriana]
MLPKTIQSKTHHIHSPFQFIQTLENCQKGQQLKGLQHLKKYLQEFGYLKYNVDHHSEVFNDLLESAIKTYQCSYGLNVTGILDSDTVNQMMKPRCGVPDYVNNGGTKPRHGHDDKSPFHSVAHYQFIPGTPRWSKSTLTYTFNSTAQVPNSLNIKSVFQSAFQKWAGVTRFSFKEVPKNSPADIVIGFHRLDHGDGNPFDGFEGVLAHAFPPSYGKCHFDGDEMWSRNPGPNELDLESVAMHELGHILGLGHEPTKPEAIMFPTFDYRRIKRDLNIDDIQGFQSIDTGVN